MTTHTEVPKSFCTNCGLICDMATHPFSAEPEPGDASICIRCGHIAIFGTDLKLRKATRAERKNAMRAPMHQKMRSFILQRRN